MSETANFGSKYARNLGVKCCFMRLLLIKAKRNYANNSSNAPHSRDIR
jgi:hypothetical protein